MARHRPKTSTLTSAKADIAAAVLAAKTELKRRSAYSSLRYMEDRIAEMPGVPGDPPYVEQFSNFPKS